LNYVVSPPNLLNSPFSFEYSDSNGTNTNDTYNSTIHTHVRLNNSNDEHIGARVEVEWVNQSQNFPFIAGDWHGRQYKVLVDENPLGMVINNTLQYQFDIDSDVEGHLFSDNKHYLVFKPGTTVNNGKWYHTKVDLAEEPDETQEPLYSVGDVGEDRIVYFKENYASFRVEAPWKNGKIPHGNMADLIDYRNSLVI
jgi:hypothetical protein